MSKVKFKIVSGDTTLQDYCSKTGSSWTLASEDSKLLNYGEAIRIKDKVAFGPFGGPLEIVEVELPKAEGFDMMNEWVDYK